MACRRLFGDEAFTKIIINYWKIDIWAQHAVRFSSKHNTFHSNTILTRPGWFDIISQAVIIRLWRGVDFKAEIRFLYTKQIIPCRFSNIDHYLCYRFFFKVLGRRMFNQLLRHGWSRRMRKGVDAIKFMVVDNSVYTFVTNMVRYYSYSTHF